MNSLCNGGAAKKGAAFYFTLWKVPSWLYTHNPPAPQYASEPVPPPVCRHSARCEGCPYMAALGGADIINAVTREEHTGGIPTTHSILEAIDTACTVAQIVNDTRFPNLTLPKNKYHNCMGDPEKIGCDRCGQECPFLWNNID